MVVSPLTVVSTIFLSVVSDVMMMIFFFLTQCAKKRHMMSSERSAVGDSVAVVV